VIELAIGATFASIGALLPVVFPSGRRWQLVLVHAVFALLLVAGPRAALAAAWIAAVLPAVRVLAWPPADAPRARLLLALAPAPVALTVAVLAGHAATLALGGTYPLDIHGFHAIFVCGVVLWVTFFGFIAVKELLERRLAVRIDGDDEPVVHEGAGVQYVLAVVVGGPLQLQTHGFYVLGATWMWASSIAWSFLLHVIIAARARADARTVRLLRQLAASERLAAIGETTARVAHQMRHQIGLIGMSLHSIESRLGHLGADDAAVLRAELEKLQHAQDELRRVLVGGPGGDGVPSPPPSSAPPAAWTKVVRDQLDRLAPLAQERGVRLHVDLSGLPETGPVDPDKLGQGWFNVVENALAAAASTVRVYVRRDGSAFDLCVEDDGPGMSEASLPRATEPFFTTKPGGTGMGLAIARAVVEEEGGSLALARRDPHGIRATLRFPSRG
jgi:signal transduction histidine kinase